MCCPVQKCVVQLLLNDSHPIQMQEEGVSAELIIASIIYYQFVRVIRLKE